MTDTARPSLRRLTLAPLAAIASLGFAGTAAADSTPLVMTLTPPGPAYAPGTDVTISFTGAVGGIVLLAFDQDPGPVVLPGIGSIDLGFTDDFIILQPPLVLTDGTAEISCGLQCGNPLLGVQLYTQAVSIDPVSLEICLSNSSPLQWNAPSGGTECASVISGYAFYDFNNNGVWDLTVPEELPLPGWRIELYKDGVLSGCEFTEPDGSYEFIRDLDGSTYTVLEIAPPPGYVPLPGGIWIATTPTQADVVTSTAVVDGPDFGNLGLVNLADPETGLGPGLSKGFWSNMNGKALLSTCDPTWRDALNGSVSDPVCLRDEYGNFFTISTTDTFDDAFDAWNGFVVGDGLIGVAGYMLSTQLAAALLNTTCGNMQGLIYIDRFQDGVLVEFGELVDGAVGLLCDPRAVDTSPQTPYFDLRQAMLNCYLEFSSINDTGSDPSNPQVTYGTSGKAPDYTSPY
jgi:hypothetical protein